MTYHAYQRAKDRVLDKIINKEEKNSFLLTEIKLNEIINKANNIDIEYGKNEMVFYKIPFMNNLYIVTRKNIIITIKPTTISNLNKNL